MKWITIILLVGSAWSITWPEKIKKEMAHYGVWSNILYSMAIEESSLNPYACSEKFAHGLLQVRRIGLEEYNRLYGTDFELIDLYDYKINIRVAHGLIWDQYQKWNNNLYMALASYNAGRQRVLDYGVASHDYCKKIIKRFHNEVDHQIFGLTYLHRRPNLLPTLGSG